VKIPTFIISIALTAIIGVEAWTLLEVIDLKIAVATLGEKIKTKDIAQNEH